MGFDVRVARLPGLQVQVDLEPRLLVTQGVRDLDDEGTVAIRAGLTFDSPQELEELFTCIWVHLDPQIRRLRSLWVMKAGLSSSLELQGGPTTAGATLRP